MSCQCFLGHGSLTRLCVCSGGSELLLGNIIWAISLKKKMGRVGGAFCIFLILNSQLCSLSLLLDQDSNSLPEASSVPIWCVCDQWRFWWNCALQPLLFTYTLRALFACYSLNMRNTNILPNYSRIIMEHKVFPVFRYKICLEESCSV